MWVGTFIYVSLYDICIGLGGVLFLWLVAKAVVSGRWLWDDGTGNRQASGKWRARQIRRLFSQTPRRAAGRAGSSRAVSLIFLFKERDPPQQHSPPLIEQQQQQQQQQQWVGAQHRYQQRQRPGLLPSPCSSCARPSRRRRLRRRSLPRPAIMRSAAAAAAALVLPMPRAQQQQQ